MGVGGDAGVSMGSGEHHVGRGDAGGGFDFLFGFIPNIASKGNGIRYGEDKARFTIIQNEAANVQFIMDMVGAGARGEVSDDLQTQGWCDVTGGRSGQEGADFFFDCGFLAMGERSQNEGQQADAGER